jgi:hypothetical protein
MSDIYGLSSGTRSAFFDPDTQSWKMFGDISLWGDYQLLETLPPSGMTRNGVLFLQPPWEPITDATESLLWPTPRTVDHKINASPAELKRHSPSLGAMVQMWPTPRAGMQESRNHTVWARSLDQPQNLENRVAAMEPEAIGGKLNPTWVEWLMGFPAGWTDLEDSGTL